LNIQYLTYQEIDFAKWDFCVSHSSNKLIYVESNYLNQIATNWDAIVLNDYDAVMPLIWRKKMGIRYLYQPAFLQQAGIYSPFSLTEEITEAFISLASTHFKFAEISINYANTPSAGNNFYQKKINSNFLIHLNKKYEEIITSKYIKDRITRASRFDLQYAISTDVTKCIKTYKKLYGERLSSLSKNDYKNFEQLCIDLQKENRIIIREVYNKEGKELLATALFLKDENRIYNLASSIFPNGRTCLANYFLFNSLIKEFSNQPLIIDLEGSDLPGVDFFYKKLASENQPYYSIKWNNLPKIIQLIKP
jgi:hypothetical protein